MYKYIFILLFINLNIFLGHNKNKLYLNNEKYYTCY